MANFSLTFSGDLTENPLVAGKPNSVQEFMNLLERCLSGQRRDASAPLSVIGRTHASGTITAAAVQVGDTFTINGQALTATQQYARGTVTAASVLAADTFTLQGVVLTARQHFAKATATMASVLAGDTVTVNGQVFTAGTSQNLATGQFDISSTDTAAATSLAACIVNSVDTRVWNKITATSALGVVTIRSLTPGTAGNAYTLTSSNGTRLAVTGSGFLAGGTAVANKEFDMSISDTATAASIVAAIANNSLLSSLFTAANAAGVVTIRAVDAGTGPNSYTLASSDGTRLAVSAATLAGGAAIANNQFDFGGTNAQTAASMAAAVQASSTAAVDNQFTATSDGAVVTVRAIAGGPAGNALTLVSSNGTRLAVSGSGTLTGGNTTANDISFSF